MAIWFTLTLFVSAALLFLVQPLFARLVLPLLGGTPAVWNTCMVFFQAVLLLGYAYAHAAPSLLRVRRHALLHLILMAAALPLLPLALPSGWMPPADGSPVLWLLAVLTATVGLPFFVVATSGPLLQRWFAQTRHADAGDPYFLYAASNAGSLLGLLCYPLVLEPWLPLAEQSRLWAAGYLGLMVLTAGCALILWRTPRFAVLPPVLSEKHEERPRNALRWVLLAFVPSSLLLSVTSYLTTDIAAVPLLWVVPLALYLLTFILAFSRWPRLPHTFLARWSPLVMLVIAVVLLTEATDPVWAVMPLHLFGLFWIGLVCHGQLARERPPATELTAFYLWLALGGVLGGVFNALLAPLLFDRLIEYPLVLVLACLMLPSARAGLPPARRRDVLLPAAVGLLTLLLVVGVWYAELPASLAVAVIFPLPAVLCYTFHERPLRFGLGVGAMLLASGLHPGVHGRIEYRERSFFAAHRVTRDPDGEPRRRLVHGNTVHGQQYLDPVRRREALAYYHRTGPAGRALRALRGDSRLGRVAFIGMGTGALASYGEEGQRWTFFEIDPAVVRIARDTGLFTYLSDSPAEVNVVLGDGRLGLARSGERFGLIVVDAFTSDSIPTHLLTREALRVYREHLTPDGLLLFHISNNYLDLKPILAALASDADPPMVCYVWDDTAVSKDEQRETGKQPSSWMLLASRPEDVAAVVPRSFWEKVQPHPDVPVWRDDYTNLLRVFRWPGHDE